jgi:ElaB/YqjD/DUF883 family membrane-anchored ribosome-binding protein
MKIRSRRTASGVTLLAAAFIAAGCGQSTEDAEAQLCADLAHLRSAVGTLADTSADTSVDEFQQSRENVQEAWADVQDSARNLADDRSDDLEDAWSDFEKSVKDVDDDDSLSEAASDISSARDTFDEQASDIYSGLDCSGEGSSDE